MWINNGLFVKCTQFKEIASSKAISFGIIMIMKAVVVYRENSDYGRIVTDWLRDFYRQTGKEIEQVDPDSRSGASFCRAYDIVEYPTIIALDDGGVVQNTWTGKMLPMISEVSYYAQ